MSPVEARTAPNTRAEAPWRHSASSPGSASQDAQLEGCSVVHGHVTSGSMHLLYIRDGGLSVEMKGAVQCGYGLGGLT
jgi:hypothetical protein